MLTLVFEHVVLLLVGSGSDIVYLLDWATASPTLVTVCELTTISHL